MLFHNNDENFSMVRYKTNNTLNIGIEAFIKKRRNKDYRSYVLSQTKTILETNKSGDFNNYPMIIEN